MENVGAVKELCKLTVCVHLNLLKMNSAESCFQRNYEIVGKPIYQLVMDVAESLWVIETYRRFQSPVKII